MVNKINGKNNSILKDIQNIKSITDNKTFTKYYSKSNNNNFITVSENKDKIDLYNYKPKFNKNSIIKEENEEDYEYSPIKITKNKINNDDNYISIQDSFPKISLSSVFNYRNSYNNNLKTSYNNNPRLSYNPDILRLEENNYIYNSEYSSDALNNIVGLTDKISIINNFNNKNIDYFGLYTDHFNNSAAKYLKKYLHNEILSNTNFIKNIEEVILKSYKKIDNELLNKYNSYCSSTSVIITNNKMYITNLGTNKIILSKNNGKIIKAINNIHDVYNENERRRILKNKGTLIKNNTKIISEKGCFETSVKYLIKEGSMVNSRMMGNYNNIKQNYNNIYTANPDICDISIQNNFDFIVICSKGIYNALNNDEIIEFINNKLKSNTKLSYISKLLNKYSADKCKNKYNCSNIIIYFNNTASNNKIKKLYF